MPVGQTGRGTKVDYRGVPAPVAAPPVPEPPGVAEPGARVDELRFALEPQAAEAESENDVIARIVSTAKIFFMTSSRTELV